MFKKKSYNVQKEASKSDSASLSSTSASSGTMTLQKKEKIKQLNNKSSPTYQQKIYPKKTTSEWKKNETFKAKNEKEKVTIPKPKPKLTRT